MRLGEWSSVADLVFGGTANSIHPPWGIRAPPPRAIITPCVAASTLSAAKHSPFPPGRGNCKSPSPRFSRPSDERFQPTPKPPTDTVPPLPKLTRHISGAGRVRWTDIDGQRREKYFTLHGTLEYMEAYTVFCREWHAQRGRIAPSVGGVDVDGLVQRYVEYAEATFRKHGWGDLAIFRSCWGRLTSPFRKGKCQRIHVDGRCSGVSPPQAMV